MSLTERLLSELYAKRQKILEGGINSIPSPFKRFSNDLIGIQKSKYYLVTARAKEGKTQFASYYFIFHTLLYAMKHPDKARVKILYFALEETKENVLSRFISYLLYINTEGKIRVSPTELHSLKNEAIPEEILNLLQEEEYQSALKFFEDNVIFFDSSNATGIFMDSEKYAKAHGTIYKNKVQIKSKNGELQEIEVFDRYEADDEDEYRIIFVDHVSLLSKERGYTTKESIDKLSEYCVILRNNYHFTPVIIQQQSTESDSIDAIKLNRITPTVSGLSDSKYTQRDANIVLGIFSPFKFDKKEWKGYDITIMKNSIRFLEILANREGPMGGVVPLFFDGTVCYFNEMPRLDNQEELNKVYNYTKNLDDNRKKGISFFSYVFKKCKEWLT